MTCLARLSNTLRATALLLAVAIAVLTVDTTGALAWHQSRAVHKQVVAAASAAEIRSVKAERS
jgi:hypothetical protein